MSPAVESLFTLLFKYKPFVFEKGRLLLSPSWPAVLVAVVLIVAAVPAIEPASRTLLRRDFRSILRFLRFFFGSCSASGAS